MNGLILLDWGNTLMRDDPTARGPMCDWPSVHAMPDAEAALRYMASHVPLALASGARDSDAAQIRRALARVGLDQWFERIFVGSEIGCGKSAEFYRRIAAELSLAPSRVVMIGNDLQQDVRSAREAGMYACWVPDNGATTADEPRLTLQQAAQRAVAWLATI
ncbi:MAG: HAD family hydrolase [Gammaproteobacteria bacterium]|nr:HAD family hydrolase [Gammaproteobacteria bacterium]